MNDLKIAAALRVLALAFESDAEVGAQPGAATPAPEPQKRGRGRPAKGEESAVPAVTQPTPTATVETATPAATPESEDPFDQKAPASTATLDEVRAALKGLAAVTSQEKALGVLKTAGGAPNLTDLKAEKYGVVVAAVNVELRIIEAAKAPVVEADPFETPAAATKTYTLEDVKAEVVKASKRTSQDTVAKVVMDLGGKAPSADARGGYGPSWKALPVDKYAEAIAAIQALPTTK